MKKLIAIGETKFIEFKKEYTKTLLKTISAFANYHNGNIFPKPYYEIEYDEIENKSIISIKVYKGENTPYTLNNKAYKRMDTSTVQVDKWGYEDLVLRGRNLSFDSLNCSYGNLSVNYLERKLREKLGIGKLSEDMLKSLELIKNDKYTNAMELLSDVLDCIIVFKAKKYAYLNDEKYISIYKAFAITRESSCKIRDSLFKNTKSYWSLINEIIDLILKRALKSKKKYKKRADEIVELTKRPLTQLA